MAQITSTARCACGNVAVITKSKDGHTIHKCFTCMAKPPPLIQRLRQRDNKMLRQLGLIA